MLNNLTVKKDIRTFSVSPENLTGEKGKGGMATEGSASYAARELGQGWKVNPYFVSQPGETLVLADVKGQGAIKHIWITDSAAAGRLLILRIYFDGHKNPAVEAPLSDFFCNADYREYRQLSSLAMCVNPGRGMNCYFEMPYFKSFRVEIENIGADACNIYYQIDCEEKALSPDTLYGYLVFDRDDRLLAPFRTWRNTMTEEAAGELTELFDHQIPQRWSIAHLYQSVLEQQEHVRNIRYMTTLSGYVHWMLSGEKVLGIDDASGMFPIDPKTKDYYGDMLEKFDTLIAGKGYPWKLRELLPKVLVAGEKAGILSERGARLLDPTGKLRAGIPMCPPAGDAGTGMIATNSVKPRTGNVSAGTSVFSMIVLEKKLSRVYPEIDIVTTPEGNSVAMVHCNNCTSDLNGWVNLFREFCNSFGIEMDDDRLFGGLFRKALEGDTDCGGLLSYNYLSGEHITHFNEGRPLFVREQNARFTLANFMRAHLFSALATLKLGNDLLLKNEGVKLDSIWAHGGLFKTTGVGQKILASALETPVSVMKTAGEGGAWGIAVLAAYMLWKEQNQTLGNYLEELVFANEECTIVLPDSRDVEGFREFISRYEAGFSIERAAVNSIK